MIAPAFLALVIAHAASTSDGSTYGLPLSERVRAEEVIRRVYHAHQIGETRSFDEAWPIPVLERRVSDYLQKSEDLQRTWGTELRDEDLDAELERITTRTLYPDRLQEIVEALERDRLLLRECLARPALAARALVRAQSVAGTARADVDPWLPLIPQGQDCPEVESWTSASSTGAPADRTGHSVVWTGTEMIVWGGSAANVMLSSGGRYDPLLDLWTPTSTIGAPSPRLSHSAVWTGTKMIIWGGLATSGVTNTGGRYDPITDTWSATSIASSPPARAKHSAVWTGNRMIVFGGTTTACGGQFSGGAEYDPGGDSWLSIPSAQFKREGHTAVWTGTEMIVWGGRSSSLNPDFFCENSGMSHGTRYSPSTHSWSSIGLDGLIGRVEHSAVWTGVEMIVWGGGAVSLGGSVGPSMGNGAAYRPLDGRWRLVSTLGAASARRSHTAVWTGGEMVVWGGYGPPQLGTGGRYDPFADSWLPTTLLDAPTGSAVHTAVWTGGEMIVWGGFPSLQAGRYIVPAPDADGDGLCANEDNCPDDSNAAQADVDSDGRGDACDVCPLDLNNDQDQDSVCSDQDNCPVASNPTQADADLDAVGDVCDNCPGASNLDQQDTDADTRGDACDNCPATTNADQLNSDSDGFGDVCDNCRAVDNASQRDTDTDGFGDACDGCPDHALEVLVSDPSWCCSIQDFALSPDEARLVYRSDPPGPQPLSLFSNPSGGGANVMLNGPVAAAGEVYDFEITPDSSTVIFKTDSGGPLQTLYSVPIAGGTPVKLAGPMFQVLEWKISPNSGRVVYVASATQGAPYELYSVPTAGGAVVKLSPPPATGGVFVSEFAITPDGNQVVFIENPEDFSKEELYRVPIAGGTATKLTPAFPTNGGVLTFRLPPDGLRVVYLADRLGNDVLELFSRPLAFGPTVKLNGPLTAGAGVIGDFKVTADSTRVIYRADWQKPDLFAVNVAGGNLVQLNPATQQIGDFKIAPNASRVVYRTQTATSESDELFSVPTAGGAAVGLHPPLVAGGDVQDYSISPDSARVVYLADQEIDNRHELYSVPITGGGGTKLNGLFANAEVFEFDISPDSEKVVYRAKQQPFYSNDLFRVPITGGLATRLHRGGLNADAAGDFVIESDSGHVVFRADLEVNGKFQIYRSPLGPDDDGDFVLDICDCDPANPQVFGLPGEVLTVTVASGGVLAWPSAAPDAGIGTHYDVLQSMVAAPGLEVCAQDELPTPSWTDAQNPSPGAVFFYLIRATNTCGAGTYGFDSEGVERISSACD